MLAERSLKAGLVHRHDAAFEQVDAGGVDIDTGDTVADGGQADSGGQADVAQADDDNVQVSPLRRLAHGRGTSSRRAAASRAISL